MYSTHERASHLYSAIHNASRSCTCFSFLLSYRLHFQSSFSKSTMRRAPPVNSSNTTPSLSSRIAWSERPCASLSLALKDTSPLEFTTLHHGTLPSSPPLLCFNALRAQPTCRAHFLEPSRSATQPYVVTRPRGMPPAQSSSSSSRSTAPYSSRSYTCVCIHTLQPSYIHARA